MNELMNCLRANYLAIRSAALGTQKQSAIIGALAVFLGLLSYEK